MARSTFDVISTAICQCTLVLCTDDATYAIPSCFATGNSLTCSDIKEVSPTLTPLLPLESASYCLVKIPLCIPSLWGLIHMQSSCQWRTQGHIWVKYTRLKLLARCLPKLVHWDPTYRYLRLPCPLLALPEYCKRTGMGHCIWKPLKPVWGWWHSFCLGDQAAYQHSSQIHNDPVHRWHWLCTNQPCSRQGDSFRVQGTGCSNTQLLQICSIEFQWCLALPFHLSIGMVRVQPSSDVSHDPCSPYRGWIPL